MSAETVAVQELNRSTRPSDKHEIRMVHIGLGAFHRAHQAWYTAKAGDGWGIGAFTGRSAKAATDLQSQDGLYTLITRQAKSDSFEVIDSIVAAHDGNDLLALSSMLSNPSVALVTMTITEAGYKMDASASQPALDLADPQVIADLAQLNASFEAGVFARASEDFEKLSLGTAAARLVVALAARRAADGWPLAVVSCDNLPDNGQVARASILGFAAAVDSELASWIERRVSFVATSIDRITPGTTELERDAVRTSTGYADVAPVVTEPFSSWVLSGEFPAGRPAWELAGAQFVEDLEPFERRKLWLLNGAHSLLSFAGQLRGHRTVAQAVADDQLFGWVQEFWDAAEAHLDTPGLQIPAYRRALRERFENPRIAHQLAQIANDGSLKLAARAVPVYRAERAAGRDGRAALRALAAWCSQLAAQAAAGQPIIDPRVQELSGILQDAALADGSIGQTAALLRIIDASLAEDAAVCRTVAELRTTMKDS